MHTLRKKCICARACAHMQRCRSFFAMKLLRKLVLSLARASCRLSLPPAQLLSRLNQSPDARRSRNPSKSTLAHDTVAAAVSHKHHSIIRIGAGLIQFDCKSHSRLATELTLDKVLFSPWVLWAFQVVGSGILSCWLKGNCKKAGVECVGVLLVEDGCQPNRKNVCPD